jgi:hypothetical protein
MQLTVHFNPRRNSPEGLIEELLCDDRKGDIRGCETLLGIYPKRSITNGQHKIILQVDMWNSSGMKEGKNEEVTDTLPAIK